MPPDVEAGPSFTLREFRYPDDYPAALALWEQSGPGVNVGRSDQPEYIQQKLGRDPDLFLVAEAGGQLVGTVIGGFDGRRGLVYHLAVAPGQRRLGIGQALMAELEQRLAAKGCIRSYLLVVAENESAIRFYEQLGWGHMQHIRVYAKNMEAAG